ncbi:ABC transporter ATP-binding protein [Parapedobacter sp. 10938]|uniref:ABC transporter ATP-binding protein n=1 Tax=Parapedobacter flavus TaxID=3110225 RepID=UPI002DBA5084|nr:ABC transporter transmembrane domain-containing protein [Parapedobacter sp. 10938]MEC3878429.1 ABC transporter transmembrane domain-containing protein [Parapedobacter sp. 10938]
MARQRLNSGNAPSEDLPKPKLTKTTLKKAGKLLAYLRPYRGKFIIGMVFLFLSSLTALTFPALLGAMIDAAQDKQSYDWLPASIGTIGAISFAILFIQSVVSFFRIRLFVEVAEKSVADMRRDSYLNLITLPLDFFSNRRVGELNSRLSADLSQIQDTMTTTFAEFIRQIITLVGGVCWLLIVSGKLTLLNLSILPILVVVAVVFGRFIRKLSRQAQDKLAESNTVVQETLQGISNVKAFVNEAYEASRYSKTLDAVVKIAVKGATYRGIFASFIIFCIFGAVVAVIWYGSVLVSAGDISVGDLTTYILYSLFVAGSMGSFPELYANIQKAIGASERVIEILDEQQEDAGLLQTEKTIRNPIDGNLTFENVSFAYPSRREITVLKAVSFDVQAGEKLAIVGPSGTGKSTIAALVLQFYKPDSGRILFDGRAADDYPLTDIRGQVAIVPQDVLLFGGTIRENIAYGRLNADAEEIIMAARRANAHDFIMDFPMGYDTLVGERGVKLSGGQRQRIAIARALLKDPAILILDEATSSLDSESERQVQQALEELMKGRTSIIIAHRLSTIRKADQIVVVEAGKVVASGTHDSLMGKGEGLYHHLYQLQLAAR